MRPVVAFPRAPPGVPLPAPRAHPAIPSGIIDAAARRVQCARPPWRHRSHAAPTAAPVRNPQPSRRPPLCLALVDPPHPPGLQLPRSPLHRARPVCSCRAHPSTTPARSAAAAPVDPPRPPGLQLPRSPLHHTRPVCSCRANPSTASALRVAAAPVSALRAQPDASAPPSPAALRPSAPPA